MPSSIEVVRRVPEGGVLIKISGVLDETFDGAALARIARGVVIIDLDELKRVTSFGAREWIRAMSDLQTTYVGFVNCRPAVVTQLNTIARFGGDADVLSMHVPYVTDDNEEFSILVDVTKDQSGETARAATPAHPVTGARGTFDDDSSYFTYVAARRAPEPPALALLLVRGLKSEDEVCRVRQQLVENATLLRISGPIDGRVRFRRIAEGLDGVVIFMFSEVTSISGDGYDHLVELLRSPSITSRYIASVPRDLLATVVRASQDTNAPIVSVLVGNIGGPGSTGSALADTRALSTGAPSNQEISREVIAALADVPEEIYRILDESGEEQASISTTNVVRRALVSGEAALEGFGDKYEVLDSLGTGGMARIFRARQRGAGGFEKIVAIKQILPGLAESRDFVEMFLSEARIAAQIRHPNVVDIYELNSGAGGYSIVMEYVEGVDLRAAMNHARTSRTQIPLGYAVAIIRDACSGLHAAYTALGKDGKTPLRILHRDVTPRNILVSTAGLAKLTDFGIAKAIASVSLTAPGAVRGKVPYLAPEQLLNGQESCDSRIDVFAAGVCLFEAITGTHPFHAGTDFGAMQLILAPERPSIRVRRPDAPTKLVDIVDRALARKREDRFSDAGEMRQALDDVLAEIDPTFNRERLGEWVAALAKSAGPVGLATEGAIAVSPPPPTASDVHRIDGESDEKTHDQRVNQSRPR